MVSEIGEKLRGLFGTKKSLLNLGCGGRFHSDWVNIDFTAHAPGVQAHDLRQPLPFEDSSCAVVYHSHVLEHFSKSFAPIFIKECHRVLASGGILRVVIPDLENIARLYLSNLEKAWEGDAEAGERYNWMVIELLDQMVRERGGGEMLRYWKQNPMPAENFVISRMGHEVIRFLQAYRTANNTLPTEVAKPDPTAAEVAQFRESGEVHKWMYDRYSLRTLLQQCGFVDVTLRTATESAIPQFTTYLLDANPDGSVRKPDSLFMEARKA